MNNDLEKFRARWRRWLGNKTRSDKKYWVTLLDSNWIGWALNVIGDDYPQFFIRRETSRETVKSFWLRAIDHADMSQLRRLDALYARERWLK